MCFKKILNFFKKSSNKPMTKNNNSDVSDTEAIKAIEQAWKKFEAEMNALKKKQLEIIKRYKEKAEQKELEEAKKEISQ